MRGWYLAGTTLTAAAVLAGLLVAPGASGAPADGATHPTRSLVVIALDYGGAIIGASGTPVELPALRRGVITASLSDYAYLHYTRRSDLGGFVPAPVGRFVAVAPVRLNVAGSTHHAQIPLYAKTKGVAGNAVQAFAFQGAQSTPSSTIPSGSTSNSSLPTTTVPLVTSSSRPPSTSTTAPPGASTSTTTGRPGGAPPAGPPPTPTSGTGAPQATVAAVGSTTTSSLIPSGGTTTTTSALGAVTTTTVARAKHPTTTTTPPSSPTSSSTTTTRPSAPPTNTTTTRPTTTTSATTTTTSSGSVPTTTTAPAGTVEMTNNHDGHSFLNATNMAPGSSTSDTVTIGNVGTTAFELTLEATTSTNDLSRALNLEITMESPPTVEYDGVLANVPASLPIEHLAAGASTTFTFTLSLPASAGNDLQNQSAQLGLTWVGQN